MPQITIYFSKKSQIKNILQNTVNLNQEIQETSNDMWKVNVELKSMLLELLNILFECSLM